MIEVLSFVEEMVSLDEAGATCRDRLLGCEVVLSGSDRRETGGLRRADEELGGLGCTVLPPSQVD
jgi:hypothetical protein